MRFRSLTWAVVAAVAVAATVDASLPAAANHHHSLYHHSAYQLKEAHAAPAVWKHDHSVAVHKAIQHVELQIAVKRQNMDALKARVLEVSNPTSASYGQYLQKHEVDAMVAPSAESVQHVARWLQAHNVDTSKVKTSANGDIMTVSLPVSKVESLLQTKYRTYRHAHSSKILLRATEYRLPAVLHDHIDTIQPTTSFALHTQKSSVHKTQVQQTRAQAVRNSRKHTPFHLKGLNPPQASASCNASRMLSCLETIYNLNNYTVSSASRNGIGIGEFDGYTVDQADLTSYLQTYRPEAANATFILVTIAGNETINAAQTNASLPDLVGFGEDLQLATALTWPTPVTVYSTGGQPTEFTPDAAATTNVNEPYLVYTSYLLSQSSLPSVLSHNYFDDERTVPLDYANRVCDDFAQLAARGVSTLFTAGNGVGINCSSTDGSSVAFTPYFPASCPWVTTVGDTDYYPEVGSPTSGGGFSNYYAQPSWQATAVNNYIANTLNGSVDPSLYNASGRAYPDVAAYAGYVPAFDLGASNNADGSQLESHGAVPVFAAIVALLNDYRLSNGLPTLGFLNPWLYQFGYLALSDVTSGSNITPGCGLGGGDAGFTAATGWDAVTGWGFPNFVKLQAAALLAQPGSTSV